MENNNKPKMDIHYLTVPSGIRYVSDWVDYNLENYPFPHILNKDITGCGYTEYCITNSQNLILCSPRRILLENKEDQHPGEVFYARNESLDVLDFDKTFINQDGKKTDKKTSLSEPTPEEIEERKQHILRLKSDIKSYHLAQVVSSKPSKILVTYDSFRHVKEALQELGVFESYQVVVDEFQSIMIDVKFKSSTEIELLNQLKDVKKLCYVSATPMLDEYLAMLDEFKDLPYYFLDWRTEDPGRVISPNLNVKMSKSIHKDIVRVVDNYLIGNFEKESYINPTTGLIEEVISNEAVIYVNSVKTICSIIAKCELTPDQCNILCANTTENNEKIRKAFNVVFEKKKKDKIRGKVNLIGSVPKKNEPHKMFTFCTRTVYLGADFYSKCARSFIFADSNIDCLTVDISMDLPQILGRQRLEINPWKNYAELYVKNTISKLTREDFIEKLNSKVKKTEELLTIFDDTKKNLQETLVETYETAVKAKSYSDSYLAVNHHAGKTLVPVFNHLMHVADIRTFDIQQVDYKDRFTVFNAIRKEGISVIEVESYLKTFNDLGQFTQRMMLVCQYGESMNKDKFELFLNSIPKDYKSYYTVLGSEKCKALEYRKIELERELNRRIGNQYVDVKTEIYKIFQVDERYLKSQIKETLRDLYKRLGYKKTPMANDLFEFFDVKEIQIKNPITKKKDHGYLILKRLKDI